MATTQKSRLILGAGLAFLGGLALGVFFGAYGGFELAATKLGNAWLYKEARDIRSHIALLRHFRAQGIKEAVEMLESRLDDDLISVEPDRRIKGRTLAEINKAIEETRRYRLANPRKSNRSSVDKMVADRLKL